jgi:hypothetical protein
MESKTIMVKTMPRNLNHYLKIANTLGWQKVPVDKAFPEIENLLYDCAEDFMEYYDYYCVLCVTFDDYVDTFLSKSVIYATLLHLHDLNVDDVALIMSFEKEIIQSMESGCTFVEALEDWDLIWP